MPRDENRRNSPVSDPNQDWRVRAFMLARPLAVPENATVLSVCETMAEGHIGQVLVVDKDWRPRAKMDMPPEPLGIFTERDLIRAFAAHREHVLGMAVSEVMTSPVSWVEPEEDIEQVGDLMNLLRIRRMPVVEKGKTVGMLTRGRMMDAMSRKLAVMERANEALEERVVHDALTGLANRVLFDRVLERELLRSEDRGGSVGVLMLDLDHFKRVNDTYGHPVGDIVLRQLADVLRETLRRADLAARVGGEEFAVVLPMQGHVAPQVAAEKIRTAVEHAVFGEAAEPLRITISIGCATAKPGERGESLLKRADTALYRAKGEGRNRVVEAA
jgi:diguanylate cyclase (GGDEF)-like protein